MKCCVRYFGMYKESSADTFLRKFGATQKKKEKVKLGLRGFEQKI